MPRMHSKTDGDEQDPMLIDAHETTARREVQDAGRGSDAEEVGGSEGREGGGESVDDDEEDDKRCCCCCRLRAAPMGCSSICSAVRGGRSALTHLERECFCKPFELSPPNREEKKGQPATKSAPPPPHSERFQPKKKSCKKFVPMRGLDRPKPRLPAATSAISSRNPKRANKRGAHFTPLPNASLFGLHSGQLGQMIRSALKRNALHKAKARPLLQ